MYMRYLILAAFMLSSCAVFAQDKIERRFSALDKRVGKVERRVTALEGGAGRQPAAAAKPKEPANPVSVRFLLKKQVVGQKKLGIKLYLEFENLSSRRFYAFNGTLVFKNEDGTVIWTRPYGHSEPLGPGERVDVSMGILSEQAKEYLKFIKARAVTVSLEKQEVYAAD